MKRKRLFVGWRYSDSVRYFIPPNPHNPSGLLAFTKTPARPNGQALVRRLRLVPHTILTPKGICTVLRYKYYKCHQTT